MKFSIKDFSDKCNQIFKNTADLVIFTWEMLNGKFHFLCSEITSELWVICSKIISEYHGNAQINQDVGILLSGSDENEDLKRLNSLKTKERRK